MSFPASPSQADQSPRPHPNVTRVARALASARCHGEVVTLPDSAHTAAEAAARLGVSIGAIAKSLVFLADGQPVLVVASGADRVDTTRLAAVTGAQRVRRADADAVRAATGYPIGGVSPAGLDPALPVYVERALEQHETVWAAAGTPHAVFPTSFAELVQLTGGTPSDVRERTEASR